MIIDEELLEPVARYVRFRAGLKHVNTHKPITLADLGCGPKIRFYHAARQHGAFISRYYGVDPLLDASIVQAYESSQTIQLLNSPLAARIPLPDASLDYVVGFAFLEHINNPFTILHASLRLLKPQGQAIFTTPTPLAQRVLEFLAFRLGVIAPREIAEHKSYFTQQDLLTPLANNTNIHVYHRYFEFGLNNLLVITKL